MAKKKKKQKKDNLKQILAKPSYVDEPYTYSDDYDYKPDDKVKSAVKLPYEQYPVKELQNPHVVGISLLIILLIGLALAVVGYFHTPNPPTPTPTPPVVVTPAPVVKPPVVAPVNPTPQTTIPGYDSHGQLVETPYNDPDHSGHHLRWRLENGAKHYFWRDSQGKRHWWPDEK
jgi:hypothetical protein